MRIDNTVIDEASELLEFIFAARDCLDNLDYKPDERLEKAVQVLDRCRDEKLATYSTILQQMTERRTDSLMMRIYGLYRQKFQERIMPF